MKPLVLLALFLATTPGVAGLAPAVQPLDYGSLYSQSADPDGLAALQSKAEQGDPDALNNLGIRYARGKGLQRDYRAAARYFRQAALLGYAPAMANLGFLYESGVNGPPNYREAYAWLLLAISAGIVDRDHDVTVFRLGMLAARMGPVKVTAAEARAKQIAAIVNRPCARASDECLSD